MMQHIVHTQPVHGKEKSIRILRSLARRARASIAFRILGKLIQLLHAARIAENHLMPGTREQRPELAAHQPRTENANAHAALPISRRR